MTKSRIITVITDEEGNGTYTGLDADNHLATLDISTDEDSTFVDEVKRKVNESNKE